MSTAPDVPKSEKDGLSAAKQRLLAERIRRGAAGQPAAESIPARAPGTPVPISAEQYRIWLHTLQQPDFPIYNEPVTVHRHGSFSLATMEATFTEILRRHEAWRTSFSVVDGELVQVIHDTLPVAFEFNDLSPLEPEEREAEATRLRTADARLPIPMDGEVLFRGRVLKIAENEHRLQLVLHHIVFDGVSLYRTFMPEVAAIYEAFEAGKPSPLPEPKLQYGDYALWRTQHVESAAVAKQIEYWKVQLGGELPVMRFPADRPRPATISSRGSMHTFHLPQELVDRLKALAKVRGVTLYMAMLTVFKILMFRYSGQEDVIVGGTTDARRRRELEGLMGYFLDTFAVRTRPTASRTFDDYLAEVKAAVLGAFAHADAPFDRVVQAVNPRRDPSYHPLFQAFFSIQPLVGGFPAGWDLTEMDVTVGASKFDIYAELDERPDGMAARILYNTDIFESSTIERMAAHWRVLLEAVCDTPHGAIGTLPLLTPGELEQVAQWNSTAAEYPQQTLQALVTAQATATPTRHAATFASETWTYAQLESRANFLAARLRDAGAAAGSLVAVLLPRSLDLLAGMIAILKTGAAYLPLDPDVPRARTELCLREARPAAVLTVASLQDSFDTFGAQLVLADEAGHADAFAGCNSLEDSAYVIHTSGSTGVPKAVEITHRNLANLLHAILREPGMGADDVLLAVTTVSFDIAALELFTPLVSGARVVIASREESLDPQMLAALIESSGCTVMQATPSTWRALLGSGWRGASRTLRVLCGGEPLPRVLAEQLLACGLELWNMYGPTETTIWSTLDRVSAEAGPVSIGKPMANTTAYVLDAQRELLPVGAPGELYLGGDGLARGYRGQPEMTAERFVTVRGERLYRTGDMAVRRDDGRLECMGRVDNQVKVRGFRVELEAVEGAVMKHPEVAAAAARVWPDSTGGTRLSVYVTARETRAPNARDLRNFLQQTLPEYMIPSDVIELRAIPQTSNGKVDRAALPEPVRESHATTATPATTLFEQRLSEVWAKLLVVESVGVEDNFFDLGGHSLLVAALQHRIAVAFGERIAMAKLFYAPTVREQALLIEDAVTGASSVPDGIIALQPRGSRPKLFWLMPPPSIRNLTEALGSDQPVMGVSLTQADLDVLGESPTFEQIAAVHADAIVREQPHGTYYVGGLCTGGILAYAVAVELERRGLEVGLAVLLDSVNPVFYKRVDNLMVELSKLRFHLKRTAAQGERYSAAMLLRRAWSRTRAIGTMEPVNATEMTAEQLVTDRAAYPYRPAPLKAKTLLLQPQDRPAQVNYIPGWKTVVKDLVAMDVTGHHDELLQVENVPSVAGAVTTWIDAVAMQPQR